MRLFHLFISLIFLLFAIVQWNDPDSLVWILIYLAIAIIAFYAFRGRLFFWINLSLTLSLLTGVIFYIPDLTSWLKDGMPSITESMKASSPYIEFIREFFGLLIALITMSVYLVISKKKQP